MSKKIVLAAAGLLVALAVGFAVGRLDGGSEPESTSRYVAFDATVTSVDKDNTRVCLAPLDPLVSEQLGEEVCGRAFPPPGLEPAGSARWHVEWFTATTADGESPDAMVLSLSDRERPATNE